MASDLLLLGEGVDVESESESGTPLVWATGHGQQDAVKLLLEHNAKVVAHLCVLSAGLLIRVFSYSFSAKVQCNTPDYVVLLVFIIN